MSLNPYGEVIAEFRRLATWLAHVREQTDAHFDSTNRRVDDLAQTLPQLVVLGDPILEVDYDVGPVGAPPVILQAAIRLPVDIFGVVRLNQEALKDADTGRTGSSRPAPEHFQPYNRGQPNLRTFAADTPRPPA